MTVINTIPWDKILEVLGFSVGLLYLWWEYHADPRLWFASIVMPAISMWIYFSKGIYADFAINIYYLLIAVYGYITWTRHGNKSSARTSDTADKANLPITHIPVKQLAAATAIFTALWGILYFILHRFTDSTIPLADAFTTSLSIVAMWMLAKKYLEQWIAWMVVDAVCVGLYIYKEIYFYAILYLIYTIIATIGYRKWHRMMHTPPSGK